MLKIILIYIIFFFALVLIIAQLIPLILQFLKKITSSYGSVRQKKIEKVVLQLDDMFVDFQTRKLQIIFIWAPLLLGALIYLIFSNFIIALASVFIGTIVPELMINRIQHERKRKFRQQLPEVIFTISSSLRAGLSLHQCLEVVATDMAAPASQEFSLVVKAYRMGMDLRDALGRIKVRMSSNELKLLIILFNISGETGGDIITLLDNLGDTIREREKLSEKIITLTLQGKLQAYIMGVLPVVFIFIVRSSRPDYFNILFSDPIGRMLIAGAIGGWILAMFLLYKLSKVEVY